MGNAGNHGREGFGREAVQVPNRDIAKVVGIWIEIWKTVRCTIVIRLMGINMWIYI